MISTEGVYRLLAFLILLTVLSISAYYRRKADRMGGKLDSSQGQGLLIILRLCGILALMPFIAWLISPSWMWWTRVDLPHWLRWIGAIAGLLMIPAFYWLFSSLDTNISPTQGIRHGHKLVTSGPYRTVRHPLYSFGFIFMLALTLLSTVWTVAVGLAIAMAMLVWRTPKEEANLIAEFGHDYVAYMNRTGCYLPKLRRTR